MNAQAAQMKGVVGELVALVGGRGSRRVIKDSKKNRKEMSWDTKINPGTRKEPPVQLSKEKESSEIPQKAGEVHPDQVIPMDEGNFKDF